ncbi:hypothetical protein WM26_18580 [Burkholderia cepacia]|nr:hypothetical protein WM26_18580 [Burkholderia cepacia]
MQKLAIQRIRVSRIVGIPMTIRTQGDAVPHTITFIRAKDVMHVQKTSITLLATAASALACVRPSKHLTTNLRVAPDLGTYH